MHCKLWIFKTNQAHLPNTNSISELIKGVHLPIKAFYLKIDKSGDHQQCKMPIWFNNNAAHLLPQMRT